MNQKEDDQDWQGNWGYLDQQAALKWVHTHAYLFGGDKDRVTIAGWSAGAGSVFAHMTLPSSWPYFQKAAATAITLNKISSLKACFFTEC